MQCLGFFSREKIVSKVQIQYGYSVTIAMVSSEIKNALAIRVIHKALQTFSLLDKAEKEKLYLFFSLSSFGAMPKTEIIRSQVVDLATEKMIERIEPKFCSGYA